MASVGTHKDANKPEKEARKQQKLEGKQKSQQLKQQHQEHLASGNHAAAEHTLQELHQHKAEHTGAKHADAQAKVAKHQAELEKVDKELSTLEKQLNDKKAKIQPNDKQGMNAVNILENRIKILQTRRNKLQSEHKMKSDHAELLANKQEVHHAHATGTATDEHKQKLVDLKNQKKDLKAERMQGRLKNHTNTSETLKDSLAFHEREAKNERLTPQQRKDHEKQATEIRQKLQKTGGKLEKYQGKVAAGQNPKKIALDDKRTIDGHKYVAFKHDHWEGYWDGKDSKGNVVRHWVAKDGSQATQILDQHGKIKKTRHADKAGKRTATQHHDDDGSIKETKHYNEEGLHHATQVHGEDSSVHKTLHYEPGKGKRQHIHEGNNLLE